MLLLALGALAACGSGIRPYANSLHSNLYVKTASTVNTSVDIYEVNPDCSTAYSGNVKLDQANVEIGIPTGRSSYLVFVFTSSSFLSGSSSTSYETLLRPRADHIYDIDVSYQDSIYNVVISEKRKGSKAGREVETKNLSACRPL